MYLRYASISLRMGPRRDFRGFLLVRYCMASKKPRKQNQRYKNAIGQKSARRINREALHKHATRRAYQRYGLVLEYKHICWLCHQAKNGVAEFVESNNQGRSVFKIEFIYRTVYYVFDHSLFAVVTFLPQEKYKD